MIDAADHLATKDRHPTYDNPRKWGERGIWNPPTFNVVKFQKRLNRICGTADGKPIVRLVWAWQSREFFHVEFDGLGKPTKGEWRAKYRFMTVKVGDDEVDISIPRWILEQRYEPGQYWQTWQRSRYVYDPVLGRTIDKRGDPPIDGWYGYLRTVAEHDPNETCCERAWRGHRRRCWGYYREPSTADLQILQKAVRLRDNDPQKTSPHEPLPDWALDEAQRLAYAEAREIEEEGKRINHDFWHSWINSHGWRAFEDNYKTLKHGKYKFAWPTTFNIDDKSGLSIPD
jgi:hypothetical protein